MSWSSRALFVLLAAATMAEPRVARADSVLDPTGNTPESRNYGNLRVGATSSDRNGHPSLCMELAPLSFFSVEGCGTGSGFLHDSESSELAHFRGKVRLANLRTERGYLQPQLSLGFAELQVAKDEPGFDFNGTGRNGAETAGAEAGASLRLLAPLSGGVDFVGELSAGAAYLPHAPDLARPMDVWQLSVGMTAGIGF